jgi:hypothetical protein
MLNVTNRPFMLSVVLLNVVAPLEMLKVQVQTEKEFYPWANAHTIKFNISLLIKKFMVVKGSFTL